MFGKTSIAFGFLTAVVCLCGVSPVRVIVIESFTVTDYVVFPPPAFSLKWYAEIAKRPEFIESGLVSLSVATMASFVSTVLGALAALALIRFEFAGMRVLKVLFLAPLSLPALVLGLALLQFFAMYAIPRNLFAMVSAHVVITMPFAIRFVSVALSGVDKNLELAAQSLGARPSRAFFRITLPLIAPGLTASFAFSFILSFDEVAASLFLSSPSTTTLPVRIFAYIEQNYDPLVTAVSSLLILVAVVALLLIERTIGMGRLFGMR